MDESSKNPGRPRSDRSKAAILQAAFALLQERGYEGMAIEAVARRAGVGKTTIYRGWSNRQELAVESFFNATQAELEFPDTGSAREDFRGQIQQLGELLRGPTGQAMAAMIAASRTDEALRAALVSRWIEPRRRWGQARMARGVAEGQCVTDLKIDVALDVMYGPIYSRLLFGRAVPSASEIDDILKIVMKGIFKET